MKKILCGFLAFLVCANALAAPEQKGPSDLEVIIEAMVKAYAESYAKDVAIKGLETAAQSIISSYEPGTIATGLAILGIIESAQNYEKAETEGQRYSAMSHGVASAVSLVATPLVGMFVQLGVAGQDLGAAYVSKDFQLEQTRILADISKIQRQSYDLAMREFEAEKAELGNLLMRMSAIKDLSTETSNKVEENCQKKRQDVVNPQQCLTHILVYQRFLYKQIVVMTHILNFNGRFFKSANVLGEEVFNQTLELVKNTEKQLKKLTSQINAVYAQAAMENLAGIRGEVGREILPRRCEVQIIGYLSVILNLKKKMLISPEEKDWITYSLDDETQNLNSLVEGVCAPVFPGLSTDIKALTLKVLRDLR